jgi:hypothetical protein
LCLLVFLLDASAENDGENEEIFAESYDERDDHHSSSTIPKKVYLVSYIDHVYFVIFF